MLEIKTDKYDLLLSYNPCSIFEYYSIDSMHGLNLKDCQEYNNTPNDAYICGWCNYIPKSDNNYQHGDRMFVFINLSRCTKDYDLIATLYHELMHYSIAYYNWNLEFEEEIITLTDNQVKEAYMLINLYAKYLNK